MARYSSDRDAIRSVLWMKLRFHYSMGPVGQNQASRYHRMTAVRLPAAEARLVTRYSKCQEYLLQMSLVCVALFPHQVTLLLVKHWKSEDSIFRVCSLRSGTVSRGGQGARQAIQFEVCPQWPPN